MADTKHDTARIRRRVQALPINLRVRAIAEALWSCETFERDELVGYLIEAASPAAPGPLGSLLGRLPRGIRAVFEGESDSPRDLAIRALASVWEVVPAKMRGVAAVAGASGDSLPQSPRVGGVVASVGSTRSNRFEHAAPVVATSEDFRARRSVARLIADIGLRESITLLGSLACDPEPSVRHAAAVSLMRLVLQSARAELDRLGLRSALSDEAIAHARSAIEADLAGSKLDAASDEIGVTSVSNLNDGSAIAEPSVPQGIASRVAGAIAQALHAQLPQTVTAGTNRGLMTAALLAASRGEPARLILRAARALEAGPVSDDPMLATLRSTLRLSNAPLAALRAVEWLSVPSLRRSASDRLSAPRSSLDVELALGASHLLLRPARSAGHEPRAAARGLVGRGGSSPRSKGPGLGCIGDHAVAARLGAVRLVNWLDLAAPAREGTLAPLLADPHPGVRHALARGASGSLLLDTVFDAAGLVARHAFLRWSLAGTGLARVGGADHAVALARLRRSPHASLRTFARDEQALASAPAGLGDRLALRRALATNRAGAIARLGEHLGSADPKRCEHAISLIRAVGIVPELAQELLALLTRHRGGSDLASRRLTASLASLLGDLATPDATASVSELIQHEDPRVGANAVESFARQARANAGQYKAAVPGVGPLVELKADPRHRVRANALRALIEFGRDTPTAIDGLVEMLRDGRVGHRLASAWVLWRILPDMARSVGHLQRDASGSEGWPHLAASAARLASFDPDHRVRRRAAACVSRLSAATDGAWSPAT